MPPAFDPGAAATYLTAADASLAGRVRVHLLQHQLAWHLPALVPGPFDVVLCHGVLLYLEDSDPLLRGVASVLAPGGLVSLLTRQQPSLALRFVLRHRWTEALSALDADHDVGELETSRRDPYRRLSRVFHLLGRRTASSPRVGAAQAVWPPIPSA